MYTHVSVTCSDVTRRREVPEDVGRRKAEAPERAVRPVGRGTLFLSGSLRRFGARSVAGQPGQPGQRRPPRQRPASQAAASVPIYTW